METKKTSTGLDENVAAVLCYVVWWITGIIFLLLEENKVVRFHAMQSIIVFGAVTVVAAILGFGPLFFPYFGWIVWGIGIALWIVLMVKAYQGGKYKLPVAGDLAEKWAQSQPNPPQPPAAK